MPRLSLWRPNKTNDYRFIDNNIREQFTVGGLDIYIHMYEGHTDKDGNKVPLNPVDGGEIAVPIEDLLFLENPNRNYDDDVKIIRMVYNVADIDFDLSQFGLFVAGGDTLYATVHYNTMIEVLGRKLMAGDVLEIPNLQDFHPLNQLIPAALPKFYVVDEGSFAADGFSQTWQPHLWRLKLNPMKGSQEYKDILNNCLDTEGGIDGDDGTCNESCTLEQWLCENNKALEINAKNVDEAEIDVPLSGYDNDMFFMTGPAGEQETFTKDGTGYETLTTTFDSGSTTFDNDTIIWVEYILNNRQENREKSNGFIEGYLTGNNMPPNGAPLTSAVTFPTSPEKGDYVLRLDYKPEKLFQFNGTMWKNVETVERTGMYLGTKAETQRNSFVNNRDELTTTDRGKIPSRQSLHQILKPEADN